MQGLTAVKKTVDTVMAWMCIIILGVMSVLVVYQVVTRKVFNSPSAYSEVLTQYLFVWMIMYGSAYVFGLREHLDISILKDKMKGTTLLAVEVLTNVCLILFSAAVMIYGGYIISVQQMATTDAALQIPMGVIYSAIPISGLFTLFYAVYNISLAFHNHKTGDSGSKGSGSTM